MHSLENLNVVLRFSELIDCNFRENSPEFVMTVRDFALDLKNEYGDFMTENE